MDIFITLVTLAICVAIVVKANKFLRDVKLWHTEMGTEKTELLDYSATYRQTLLDLSERLMNLNKSTRASEIALENLARDYKAVLAENLSMSAERSEYRAEIARLKEEIGERAQELDDAEVELRETRRALLETDTNDNTVSGVIIDRSAVQEGTLLLKDGSPIGLGWSGAA